MKDLLHKGKSQYLSIPNFWRSEEHTSELQSRPHLVCRLLLEKKNDHLVWIHPVWWGGLPAIMKGFIDRLFLLGFAFQYRENFNHYDELLKGKTALIITTLDQPSMYY